ncbi:uncharacterized protein LOC122161907 isoform X2 [Centrocercus urophasianus]|uniref:uncharacterized protein LOC122161907 isoform X2 n=1 Tax=Centrocercus urophasianus TaxID=9002 RepID=UPI001C64A2BA|nr:uncharacterized protein LOC122161907 isoform X2 [Centrocercus urophasianus]
MPQNSLGNLHLPVAPALVPQAAARHGPRLPSPALRPGRSCCGARANGIAVPADELSTNPHPANLGAEQSSRHRQRPLVAEHAKRSRSSSPASAACSSLRAAVPTHCFYGISVNTSEHLQLLSQSQGRTTANNSPLLTDVYRIQQNYSKRFLEFSREKRAQKHASQQAKKEEVNVGKAGQTEGRRTIATCWTKPHSHWYLISEKPWS